MPIVLHALPLSRPALPAVAEWLLAHRPGPQPEDLATPLVLLPSSRAAGQLRHALLEASGGPSTFLPRIMTPDQLADRLDELLATWSLAGSPAAADAAPLPEMALRPLILAQRLARLDWLRDRPEAAGGLATELIGLFDDLRRARQDRLVLEGLDDDALLQHVEPGSEDLLLADLARVREAWRCYREELPLDQIDRRRRAFDLAARRWPGAPPSLIAAVHLGRVDGLLADLLRRVATSGVPVHWLTVAADDPRSNLLLATYRDQQSPAHPLQAIGRTLARLELTPSSTPTAPGADLPTRLAALGPARAELAPDGPVQLLSCRDAEHESRTVTDAVCTALAAAGVGGAPPPAVLVATPDPELAARIAAQLRDAGIDVDDTGGRPLLTLPAGRLLRDILRTVTAGWPLATLLEVLTHPYVRLVEAGARPDHAVRVQMLEAAIRRARKARRGLAVLHRIARDDDESAAENRPRSWRLQDLVATIEASFDPLTRFTVGPVTWSGAVAALRAVWRVIAPDRTLTGEHDPPASGLDDLAAADNLLAALEEAAAHLQPAPLEQITAALEELLGGPLCAVRPHRRQHLPVRLMGLVEARLENADLLVLAGLAQDVFPGRLTRPLFLPDRLRRHLDLRTWRAQAAESAELFLRLLHVAPRLVVTWPRERDGRPALPSPLVQRLMLAAPGEPGQAGEPRLRRRALPDTAELAACEVRHAAEPEPVPAPSIARPESFSHSSLQQYRECPYRFLMASALRLRRVEPVQSDLTAADVGDLAHRIMKRWLEPDAAGWAALQRGDRDALGATLHEAIDAEAGDPADGLPGQAISVMSLRALAPDLVSYELERASDWRPAAVEAQFSLTLDQAVTWLRAADPEQPPLVVPDRWREVGLTGKIDRVDVAADRTAQAAVLDYKTGGIPTRKHVRDGRELQLYLYGLAVELGEVTGLAPPGAGVWRLDHGGFYTLGKEAGVVGTPHLAGRADLATGVRTIVEQALAILDPEHPFALVPDWRDEELKAALPCRYCEFRGVCRLEERVKTPALAGRLAAMLTERPRETP